jgi:ribosomal-protein-alanine N-acetyltransferase
MTPVLHTPRLILRPIELADAPQVQALFANWEIVKLLNSVVPWPYPPDGAETYIRVVALPAAARGKQWMWTIRLQAEPDQVIGTIGLTANDQEENRGFWLGSRWQRQGFMTEACEVVTDYWFETLQFPVLRTTKAVANTASRRISEKQGMRLVATIEKDFVSGRLPSELWEITADEWRARRR